MNIKKIMLTGSFLYIMPELFAQVDIEADTAVPLITSGPHFFICIVAGLLLAMGFQLLLSMLTVATGISAVGDVRKIGDSSGSKSKSSDRDSTSDTIKKVTNATGVWALITVSISLFFASMLAVRLSLIGNNSIGVTLGLVIWATFLITMMYFETKLASNLVGGLFSTIKEGFSSIGSLFSQSSVSEGKSIAKTKAKQQAKSMRKELEKLFDNRDIDHKIDEYVRQLKPQKLDIDHIKEEIKNLLTDLQIEEKTVIEDGEVTKRLILAEAEKSPNISKEDLNKLSSAYDEAQKIMKKDARPTEKARMAVERFTSADREQIRQYENKIKNYLRATKKEALQPENIERDISEIFRDPSQAGPILREKIAALDRDTFLRAVTSRPDISSQDAETYVGYVEQAIAKVTGAPSSAKGDARPDKDTEGIKAKVRDFLNKIQGRGDYDLTRIKGDFTSLFNASTKDSEGLTYKLQHYDKEQMTQLVTANTSIEREKVEPIVESIIEARDSVVTKAESVKRQVELKLEEAKQEALKQAENTREVAATAAWWMVATALVSGVAAALGGIVALEGW